MTTDASVAKVTIVGRRHPERAGLRGADVRGPRRRRHQHRDDLDLARSGSPASSPRTARGGPPRAPRRLRARAARGRSTSPRPAEPARGRDGPTFLARRERFARVGSTNDVVRGWLADGTPEVCLAIADEQTAGRGREGRTLARAAGRRAAAVARLPADLAGAGPHLAAGGDRRARDGRGGRGRRRTAGRDDPPQVAERPRDRGGPAAAGVRKLAGRPRRERRPGHAPTRGSSSGSASTSTGGAADFPPDSPAR